MVLDPILQPLPVHFFGSRPQPPTSPLHVSRSHTMSPVSCKIQIYLYNTFLEINCHLSTTLLHWRQVQIPAPHNKKSIPDTFHKVYNVTFVETVHIQCHFCGNRWHTMSLLWKPCKYNVYTVHVQRHFCEYLSQDIQCHFCEDVYKQCVYCSHTTPLLWIPFTRYTVSPLCIYRWHTMPLLFIPSIGVYFSRGIQCHLAHHSRCAMSPSQSTYTLTLTIHLSMSPSQYTYTLAPSTDPRTG